MGNAGKLTIRYRATIGQPGSPRTNSVVHQAPITITLHGGVAQILRSKIQLSPTYQMVCARQEPAIMRGGAENIYNNV